MVQITLLDMAGRQLYLKTINGREGTSILSISLPALTNGIYIFKAEMNGKNYIEKVCIKH